MLVLSHLALVSLVSAAAISGTAAGSTRWSTTMVDAFIKRGMPANNRYENAVFYRGVQLAYSAYNNQSYLDWLTKQLRASISSSGVLSGYPSAAHSLDDLRVGPTLLDMYKLTSDERFKTAAGTLRKQFNTHPRTASGGFWHRDPTYKNQMWLDGIYMADVFYAQYTSLFEASNTTAWDDIVLQYDLIDKRCRNTTSNLLAHGYDESKTASWADKVTGASPHVWDRALGWYMMALVDVLEYIPKSHPGWKRLQGYLQQSAKGLLTAQDKTTGGWWLVMDEPYPGKAKNYIESSGSAMFAYSLLKAARLGYIGKEYVAPARKGYEYLAKTFTPTNATDQLPNWTGTVLVGSLGSSASYEYYTGVGLSTNDLKGVGPFIYASVEYEAL